MRIPRRLFAVSAIALCTLSWTEEASACPDGYYETCFISCWCTPNSDVVVHAGGDAVNPLPDVLNTVGGAVKGNVGLLTQGVGGLVIKAGCPGCDAVGTALMNKNDKAFVESVVGRGWLMYMGGVDPVLILADAATSTATYIDLAQKQQSKAPIPVEAPPPRGQITWSASAAECIVGGDNNAIVIGFVTPPSLTNLATKESFTFPAVDLRPGDTVVTTSNDSCPDVPSGQTKYKKARILYASSATATGPVTVMHDFLLGTLIPGMVVQKGDFKVKELLKAADVKAVRAPPKGKLLPSLAGAQAQVK